VKFAYEAFRKLRPGVPLRALHGKMKQLKRMAVFYEFAEAQARLSSSMTSAACALRERKPLCQMTRAHSCIAIPACPVYRLTTIRPPPTLHKIFCRQAMVLFATDIAARGLDFPTIDWVLQVCSGAAPSRFNARSLASSVVLVVIVVLKFNVVV
jgi:ERCC4-related helicase